MLRKPRCHVLGEPEFDAFRIEFRHQLDDVEGTNAHFYRLRRTQEPLLSAPRSNQICFFLAESERELASGILRTPLVRGDAKLENQLSGIGAIYTDLAGELFK